MFTSMISDAQYSFIVGVAITAALLFPVILACNLRAKTLEKANAHLSNDNDFMYAEMMMLHSRVDPKLMREMKSAGSYKAMTKQYKANKAHIEKTGKR